MKNNDTIKRLHLSITEGAIKDNNGRVYTIPEAREFLKENAGSIATSLSLVRLAGLSWNMEKLQAYYRDKNYYRAQKDPYKELPIIQP